MPEVLMTLKGKLDRSRTLLSEAACDGWLLYDFRRTNTLACDFLEIPMETMLTRRFFYWIPREGEPVKLVHRVEPGTVAHLPGREMRYSSWQELRDALTELLTGGPRVAMEYSPEAANPYVSLVDAGTAELVKSCGAKELFSSGDFIQEFTCVWTNGQLDSHRYAAQVLDQAVENAWKGISKKLKAGEELTEYEVQQWIVDDFRNAGCVNHGDPIVAVNGNAADPHYTPSEKQSEPIRKGDFILIDLWCKQDKPHAVYADICRVGVAADKPTEEQQRVFDVVHHAQAKALSLVKDRFGKKEDIMGWEVDQAAREVIVDAGYGKEFTHRTGHNIHTTDHGPGAHMDNLETQDCRRILPRTCFSIEPGVYLENKFGIRLETDVYIHEDQNVEVTGGLQDEILCLL